MQSCCAETIQIENRNAMNCLKLFFGSGEKVPISTLPGIPLRLWGEKEIDPDFQFELSLRTFGRSSSVFMRV